MPVSPGRIEQITGRVHRLGSDKAAQVTLLLPPEYFGTRVFEALRKAASNVFKQAAGSKIPSPPASGAEDDPYYVRELADYEARLLTAVAEASGAIRGEENRGALEQVVSQPELPNKEPNTAPIENVLKTGFDLIEEQRQRFQDEKVATLSDLMPEIGDLVDALVKFEGAKTEPASDSFHVPIGLIEDRAKPEKYGDLVTRKEPFHVLQVNKQNFWYGPQRFLPSDVPRKEGFQWLGVVGNRLISELLLGWCPENATLTDEQRFDTQIWISNGVPKGKALAFCGIANEYKADGMAAASPAERSLHVLLGFADYAAQPALFHWRPFYAKGASVPRAHVSKDTWLVEILPAMDERWAARLIRRVTGLEDGYTARITDSKDHRAFATHARESVVKEILDEDDGSKSWKLQKDPVKVWLDANVPDWWAGGTKLACKPKFFLIALGEQ